MYICMTEEQKQSVERLNIRVVDFKRAIMCMAESLKRAFDNLISAFQRISSSITAGLPKIRGNLPHKERYRLVKRISRCGFDEKQVSVMVHSSLFRCRNNC